MSVKVAVRIRPFNSRQTKLGCTLCVDMKDKSTILKPFNGEAERQFTFDYSFWSFDQFVQDKDNGGFLKDNGSGKYADQNYVYNQIGTKILDNAWQGYHCCLFAYGQTGSGKSYSMIGYGPNKGIVPVACNQIFQRIKKKKPEEQFEVHVSMLEIYNEAVQDLTIDASKRPTGGLKIRQNKLLGVYVQGAKKHFVDDFGDIQTIMEEGTKNRTIAATQMNATSSRAHTIFTIEFKKITKTGTSKSETVSMINLVDLAGSQRQDKTGATGTRLKQAVGINQSLTSLGQVISILAQNSSGANKFVPYRNSSLTRILENALGGNSQTVMICAISPANDNYDQTLSTLRYADSAKKIKNKPIVNESQTDKLIKELKAQNDRLKKLLQAGGNSNPQKNLQSQGQKKQEPQKLAEQGGKPVQNQKPVQNENTAQQQKIERQKKEEIMASLKLLEQKIAQEQKSLQQKRKEGKKDIEQIKNNVNQDGQKIIKDSTLNQMKAQNKKLPPYLQNISRDFMLNRKLKILLEKKLITVGKLGMTPPNDIVFGGRDMMGIHAILEVRQDGRVLLTPKTPSCHLYVNGIQVQKTQQLKHLDRVIFGWNSVYLFKNKDHQRNDEKLNSQQITWDFVKKEMEAVVDIDQSDSEDGGNGGCCQIY